MDFGKIIKRECVKLGITQQERAMADLIVSGWREADAYVLCFGMNPAYSDTWHKRKIEEITKKPGYVKYFNEKSAARVAIQAKTDEAIATTDKSEEQADILDNMTNGFMSKEDVMKELLRTIASLPAKDPKRADVLMKYADLTQMKKDETKEGNELTVFYLPQNCKQCELYIKHFKKGK